MTFIKLSLENNSEIDVALIFEMLSLYNCNLSDRNVKVSLVHAVIKHFIAFFFNIFVYLKRLGGVY